MHARGKGGCYSMTGTDIAAPEIVINFPLLLEHRRIIGIYSLSRKRKPNMCIVVGFCVQVNYLDKERVYGFMYMFMLFVVLSNAK